MGNVDDITAGAAAGDIGAPGGTGMAAAEEVSITYFLIFSRFIEGFVKMSGNPFKSTPKFM